LLGVLDWAHSERLDVCTPFIRFLQELLFVASFLNLCPRAVSSFLPRFLDFGFSCCAARSREFLATPRAGVHVSLPMAASFRGSIFYSAVRSAVCFRWPFYPAKNCAATFFSSMLIFTSFSILLSCPTPPPSDSFEARVHVFRAWPDDTPRFDLLSAFFF